MICDTHIHEDEDGRRVEVEIRVIPADQWERESRLLGPTWSWTFHPGIVLASSAYLETRSPLLFIELAVPGAN